APRRPPLGAIILVLRCAGPVRAAGEHGGVVVFGAVPVPGATVTAVRGDERRVTVTDQQGRYRFADIADGTWTIRVEMLGFDTISREIAVAVDAPETEWELKLLPFDAITRGLPPPTPPPPQPAPG